VHAIDVGEDDAASGEVINPQPYIVNCGSPATVAALVCVSSIGASKKKPRRREKRNGGGAFGAKFDQDATLLMLSIPMHWPL
jgi:hypothetical protein